MKMIVNGQDAERDDGITIADLLANEKIEHVRVAVELNGRIVPRSDYGKVRLRDGDNLEVVTLVGGG